MDTTRLVGRTKKSKWCHTHDTIVKVVAEDNVRKRVREAIVIMLSREPYEQVPGVPKSWIIFGNMANKKLA